jgi:hypothetical protein
MNKRTVWIAIAGSTDHRDVQRLVLSGVRDRPNVRSMTSYGSMVLAVALRDPAVVWV